MFRNTFNDKNNSNNQAMLFISLGMSTSKVKLIYHSSHGLTVSNIHLLKQTIYPLGCDSNQKAYYYRHLDTDEAIK